MNDVKSTGEMVAVKRELGQMLEASVEVRYFRKERSEDGLMV